MPGFLVCKGEYAAIEFADKGYIILHKGSQCERLCKDEDAARKYIAEMKKSASKSKAQLPIN